MGLRIAEEVVRLGPSGPQVRVRVDLHGVSVFGPGTERTLIRWEWIEHLGVSDGVEVRSATAELTLPPGAFGLPPETLGPLLEEARSLHSRPEVIERLAHRRATPG